MKKDEFFFETYVQFQKIFEIANEILDYNNFAYGIDKRLVKFNRNPF